MKGRLLRPRPSTAALRARLEALRERAAFVCAHARFGRELRLILAGHGIPTWTPAEDLSYRRWIAAHGSGDARALLAQVDAMLEERRAEIEGRGEDET